MAYSDLLTTQPVTSLLEALNCGALLVDRSGRIVYANRRMCELISRPMGELSGTPIEAIYDDEAAKALIRERIQRFEEAYESEFYVPQPDGQRVPVIFSGRPMASSGPLSNFRAVTVIDLSRRQSLDSSLHENLGVAKACGDAVLAQTRRLKHYSEELEEKVRERTAELHEANMEAIYMLALAGETRDADTGAHVLRIRGYTELLAAEIGLPRETVERYGYSAILHDVGKMVMRDEVLKKPGGLTAPQYAEMRKHTIAGERILSRKPFFAVARQIARSHHENWDGTGYPDGLAGEAIPEAARIVKIADVYDALVSRRVYKPAWSRNDAKAAILAGTGTLFDPRLIAAFEALVSRGEFEVSVDLGVFPTLGEN